MVMSMSCPETVWAFPPEQLRLDEHDVHVWQASLNVPSSTIQRLRSMLQAEELQRADRFRFPRDRHHFTIAHAVLRLLLSRYMAVSPVHIRFEHNQYGKPSLCATTHQETIRFNLSHSGKLALYAFARRRELGIDVEWIHRRIDQPEQIAERYFSPDENETLRRLPEHQRRKAFFNCWTRKEAYIKAKGRGLSLPLDQFDVSLVPGEPARLLQTRNDPPDVSRWTMHELFPDPDYAAALLVEGEGWKLTCWRWV